MTALELWGQINKEMQIREVTKKDLIRICHKSPATMYSRMNDPEKLTLGDLVDICGYLGIKLTTE